MHLSTHPTSYPTRYQEIAAKLEQELRQHYRCGDYLPAEQQLAARFEVNRHTLRRAIDQLVEKGWVQRRRRSRCTGTDAPVRLPAQRPGAF
ncbi:GntR family transcriptional regulator [Escherichia coli]